MYNIESGANPTSAPIGQGAFPSSSSVPIGSGATPNFNWTPPTFNSPKIDIPTFSTSNNNSSASRSFNIDFGSRHHHRDSFGCQDNYYYRHSCDSGIDSSTSPCTNAPSSASTGNDWAVFCFGISCLLMLIGVGVLLIIGMTTDLFKNLATSDDNWW